jgi:hypothetical protein
VIERGMSAGGMTKAIEAVMPPEDASQPWIASWAKKRLSRLAQIGFTREARRRKARHAIPQSA